MRLRSLLIDIAPIVAAGIVMAFYLATHSVQVAMLGDSITSQMAPRQSSFRAPFDGATNLGVSGNTTAMMLARVGSIPSSATHVVIQGGTNDLLNLFDPLPNYAAILNAIPSSKRVIVFGILPVDESAIRLDYLPYLNNALIHQENVAISALCHTYANCVVATGIMAKPMKGKTVDGIHPLAQTDNEIIGLLMPLLGL